MGKLKRKEKKTHNNLARSERKHTVDGTKAVSVFGEKKEKKKEEALVRYAISHRPRNLN